MLRKLLFAVWLFTCFHITNVNAQTEILKVGESIPPLRFTGTMDNVLTNFVLPNGGKKLVIIDFWGTGCKACIESFPKMEKLQEQFKDSVQIILVNSESPDSTDRFFRRMKKIKRPSLSMITGENILYNLFPQNANPWLIWLNEKGVVEYITGGDNATPEHIQSYLNGAKPPMVQLVYRPQDKTDDFDKPMLTKADLLPAIRYYSYIAKSVPGFTIGNRTGGVKDSNSIRLTTGATELELFKLAFSEGGKYDLRAKNSVILEVKDTTKYYVPKDKNKLDAWVAANGYSYDLKIPIEKESQLYAIMQQDLLRFFDITASIEKKKIMCFALIRTSKVDKVQNKNKGQPGVDSLNIHYYARPMKDLAKGLEHFFLLNKFCQPVIDATGYTGNVAISIDRKVLVKLDLPGLKKALNAYDLDIVEMESYIDVLVIKEKGE